MDFMTDPYVVGVMTLIGVILGLLNVVLAIR